MLYSSSEFLSIINLYSGCVTVFATLIQFPFFQLFDPTLILASKLRRLSNTKIGILINVCSPNRTVGFEIL
jgi:hypothetical protein